MKILLLLSIGLIVLPTTILASDEYPLEENADAIIEGLIRGRRAVEPYREVPENYQAIQEYEIEEEPTQPTRETLKVKARIGPSIEPETKCVEYGWGDDKIRCNTRLE